MLKTMESGLKRLALGLGLSACLAMPALSVDPTPPPTAGVQPTFGLGLSLRFGGGQPQTAIGLRVFSDNRPDRLAGSLGIDYLLGSGGWRGTLGAAYLGNNVFLGGDVGIGFGDGMMDFGAGAGWANTTGGSMEPNGGPSPAGGEF